MTVNNHILPQGFLLIDKPEGITSHDVIDVLRRKLHERRIGHAGTLDPFATGLLIVAVRREATKQLAKFVGLDKEYEATFVLGATSTTGDPEGVIEMSKQETESDVAPGSSVLACDASEKQIRSAMQTFVGEIEQMPPRYAAIKVKGKKLYDYARKGEVVEVQPRKVTIFSFELTGPIHPIGPTIEVPVKINCSSGTYIRALARDLGEKLGVGGYVKKLRRTKIGEFSVLDAEVL